MKGKIILLFVLALVALVLIGLIGQYSLRDMIISIEEASTPNQKVLALHDILQDISDAESSVRTYTITRDENTLNEFSQAASTIEEKIDRLRDLTDGDQKQQIDKMNSLIADKFTTLRNLINIRQNDGDAQVLQKIKKDIQHLKKQSNKTDEAEEQNNSTIIEKLFGPDSISASNAGLENTKDDTVISSSQLGEALQKIDIEQAKNENALKQRELALTKTDNQIMIHIRNVINHIEEQEAQKTKTRTERVKAASQKTINTITTTLIIALIIFAIMLSIIFRDISRNQRNRIILRTAKENAERLAKAKEEFLSNMSHEIRTPLNSIIGFTDQLEESHLNTVQRDYLTKIQHSGSHLLQLINDILDYAKIDSGKLMLENRGFDPASQVREIIEIFESTTTKKGLNLTAHIDESIPAVLMGDTVRFRQILINLISNAIKFTNKGSIIVALTAESISSQMINMQVSVKDTGIGIPADKMNTIFDDFAQADSSTARRYGGTGLGLSIVNKIALLHKGKVDVLSEVGKGTEFLVYLTYETGHQIEEKDSSSLKKKKEKISFKGIKALVIDDQEYNLELVDIIFKKWGISTDLFTLARDGLEAFKKNEYDIIFLDIHMPEINGIEVAREIRQFEHGNHTPIVALTAGTSQEDIEQSKEAGMNEYLLKPYTKHKLLEILLKVLGENQETLNNIEDSENQIKSSDKSNLLDLTELETLADGDDEFIRNMLQIFLSNFKEDLKELKKAVEQFNLTEIKGKSHKMSPPCRHLGFEDLADNLKSLENLSERDTSTSSLNKTMSMVISAYKEIEPIVKQHIKLFDDKIQIQ